MTRHSKKNKCKIDPAPCKPARESNNGSANRTINREDGFTLLDITILFLVVGLLAAPLIQQYTLWQKGEKRGATSARITEVETALDLYFFANGSYPCPAIPTLGPDSAIPPGAIGFGEENRAPPVPPATVGNCIVPPGPAPAFLTGSLPFKALNLAEEDVLDRWNQKLTYVVTTSLTNPATYNGNNGVLSIQEPQSLQPPAPPAPPGADNTCQPNAASPVTNIHMVVFSHGETGVGAFTNNGNQPVACAGPGLDTENCDNDATFRFPECTSSEIAGASFYDDVMYAQIDRWNKTPTTMWEEANNPNDMGSVAGYFGLGNPNPQHELDVMGNIKTTNTDPVNDNTDNKRGNALAGSFCDSNGNGCFDPNAIAGSLPQMNCSGNTGVTGINSNKADCTNSIPAVTPTTCPPGQYVIGISAGGVVTCG